MALIEIRGLIKRYGGVVALNGVDLTIEAGEVHAVCGENGAGKSTLNRILAGSVKPDSGHILVNGQPLNFGSVAASEAAGIAMVHQESAACLTLSAVENHQIMREPSLAGGMWLDRGEMKRRTIASLAEFGETFDPSVSLEFRSLAQRQMVAISRAVAGDCRLLILDEPTASLSSRETDALFSAIRKLKDAGVAVLYVSHRLDEVFALSDRVTVLRDGKWVATQHTARTSHEELVQLMVGREVTFADPVDSKIAQTVLEVKNLTSEGQFHNISFQVNAGEIVALAGLVGAGRSEVARAIMGLDSLDSGEVRVEGALIHKDAIAKGLALVPEDRQHEGLLLPFSLRDNMALAARFAHGGWIDRDGERANSQSFMESLSIKAASDLAPASSLSGGNQQKVLIGKWLATHPKVLILDEPTRGVDVGAKAQIHQLVRELAAKGVAVLVISSELSEVITLGDRILVMRQGRLAGELSRAEATQDRILKLALHQEGEAVIASQHHRRMPRELGVGLLLLAMLVGATAMNRSFLYLENVRDMLVKVAPAIIVGCMMTLTLLAREIDISVGALMGLCAATLGIACSPDRMGLPVAVGIGMCLGVGLLGGAINGLLVSRAKVPSIIVTLGMLTILRGITELAMGGKWIEHLPDGLRQLGTGAALGVPFSVWMAGFFVLIGLWITRRTRFGLQVMALGSNPSAAALRGIPTGRVTLGVFVLTGVAAAVAALFSSTQLQVIESGFGNGFELVVIASVIVGGTSIRGGRGTIGGTVLGATLLGIISTTLIFLKLGESATYWERAIQGGFILIAVLGDHLGRRKSRRTS